MDAHKRIFKKHMNGQTKILTGVSGKKKKKCVRRSPTEKATVVKLLNGDLMAYLFIPKLLLFSRSYFCLLLLFA